MTLLQNPFHGQLDGDRVDLNDIVSAKEADFLFSQETTNPLHEINFWTLRKKNAHQIFKSDTIFSIPFPRKNKLIHWYCLSLYKLYSFEFFLQNTFINQIHPIHVFRILKNKQDFEIKCSMSFSSVI